MSTLSIHEVHAFWAQESHSLASLLTLLDSRESWTLDRPNAVLDVELNEMGNPAEYLDPPIIRSLGLSEMSDMLSLLSFSRSLRLQRIFNDVDTDWLHDFSAYVEDQRSSSDSNINYSRLRLLSQFMFLGAVFSPARMDMITDSLFEVLDEE
ncbi:hypothetical protein [Marinobacterium sp. BA1]|uniref:type IVB secretion system protein IcmW n=1 Tax=Marinobacterium sp. BA1 TaxID=3138931 RepID=UPI0032E79C87